ncbi:phosphoglycolate phosphatase [Candidatus Bathyarchaeota archaeon]|nr:phosphoglycolate phosphatase [Candidatus Bathyarchaeota archaeon]
MKALALDIDGTITNQKGMLDLKAVEIIRNLEEAGVSVFLITGRNFCVTSAITKYLGTCGLAAAENGGIIWNGFKKTCLGVKERAEEGLKVLMKRFSDKIVIVNSPYRETDVLVKRTFDLNEANEALMESGVKARMLDSGVVYHIVDSSVNKGEALRKLAEASKLNVKDVAAIGDNLNDIDMLKAAGFGVAVANAPKALKNVADYICKGEYAEGFKEVVLLIFNELRLK